MLNLKRADESNLMSLALTSKHQTLNAHILYHNLHYNFSLYCTNKKCSRSCKEKNTYLWCYQYFIANVCAQNATQ